MHLRCGGAKTGTARTQTKMKCVDALHRNRTPEFCDIGGNVIFESARGRTIFYKARKAQTPAPRKEASPV